MAWPPTASAAPLAIASTTTRKRPGRKFIYEALSLRPRLCRCGCCGLCGCLLCLARPENARRAPLRRRQRRGLRRRLQHLLELGVHRLRTAQDADQRNAVTAREFVVEGMFTRHVRGHVTRFASRDLDDRLTHPQPCLR